MPTTFFNVDNAYIKNKNLQKESVGALIQWVKNQSHLPDINEAQAILFLHRWNYELETAKTAVDTYFTVKSYSSDLFLDRNPLNANFKGADLVFCTFLQQKSCKGYSVCIAKVTSPDVNSFCPQQIIKCFDMLLSLNMYEKGPCEGYILVWDLTGFELAMVAKTGLIIPKIFWYYMQKVSGVKWKQLHLINPVSYMDKFLVLVKPFLEKDLADEFYIHQTLDDLYEHVPQSCLPKDYGGSMESLTVLHRKMKETILENVALYNWEDEQIVNEDKRSSNQSNDIIDYLKRSSIRNNS